MSLGYARKLSFKEDVGAVGMTEMFDSPEVLQKKIEKLATMVNGSRHLVAFTGAGISTSCGIPDFRGPKGVWTLQREGKGVPEASSPFHCAVPSLTHMALVELERLGILKFVISQNVDCLHLRSGIPREKLAELHGNSFRELCPSCGAEYIRDFEVETIGMKQTSRSCSGMNCKAKLRDTVLDWEDALPMEEMNTAEKHCKAADVILCLGTSLQITPACNLPLKCIRGGGKIVIINLQQTPKDKKANLLIRGLVDKVIAGLMDLLNFRIPPFVRIHLVEISFCHSSKKQAFIDWRLRINSSHGPKAPLPFVRSVEVSFPDKPDYKRALLEKQPFYLKRRTLRTNPFKIALRLNFGEGCSCAFTIVEWPVNFQVRQKNFVQENLMTIQKLKDSCLENPCIGQTANVERTTSTVGETCLYACVTDIRTYNISLSKTPDANGCMKRSSGEEENGDCKPERDDGTEKYEIDNQTASLEDDDGTEKYEIGNQTASLEDDDGTEKYENDNQTASLEDIHGTKKYEIDNQTASLEDDNGSEKYEIGNQTANLEDDDGTEKYEIGNQTASLEVDDGTEKYEVVNQTASLEDIHGTKKYEIDNQTSSLEDDNGSEKYENGNQTANLEDDVGTEKYEIGNQTASLEVDDGTEKYEVVNQTASLEDKNSYDTILRYGEKPRKKSRNL